ncbi:unnamed protein product [Rotaria sp. Silwood2]|nr:unnamed protein product [Rotaria sp. Silwood2]
MIRPSTNRSANSQAPNENEMLEITQNSKTEGSNNTNQSETSTFDNTLTDQHEQVNNNSPTTVQKKFSISQIKTRLAPYRQDTPKKHENEIEKNQGFLLINQGGEDFIFIDNDNSDQQHTRHSEPCEHGRIDEDNVDMSQAQLVPTTPVTPNLVPPQQSELAFAISPVVSHTYNELDVQATRAGVECATPCYDESNIPDDTQLSATNSSSSTDSSYNDAQSIEIDLSTLDDNDYILRQTSALEQITVYEITVNNDRRDYQQSEAQNESDEFDINVSYNEAVIKNAKLKEELRRLEEEQDRIYSPWSCDVCTYINEPFIKTRKDVCEMCEGPSPLKRHTLTN